MKRLLIVTPIFPPRTGGPSTYIWELATRLRQKHQLSIICFSNHPKPLKNVNIIAISEKGNSFSRQLKLFTAILDRAAKADLVYIQGPLVVGLSGTIASKLRGAKTLLKFVGDETWETARLNHQTELDLESFYQQRLTPAHLFKSLLQRLSFALSDFIIVPSRFLKDFLADYYDLNPQTVHVIPNASSYTINKHTKRPYSLVFVGRLVPWKNLDQIIQATTLARKAHPWRITIIGEGPGAAELTQIIKSKRDSSWIKFLGRLSHDQTRDEIARAQKLILYSDYEGLPHVLIEAMLQRTAIVASDIPSNHEVTGDFAAFAPLKDVKALAKAINSKAIGVAKANQFAQRTYTWNNHLARLGKLL